MSTTVRIEAGGGVVEVKRSRIPGHIILAVDGASLQEAMAGIALRADEAERVIAAMRQMLAAAGVVAP